MIILPGKKTYETIGQYSEEVRATWTCRRCHYRNETWVEAWQHYGDPHRCPTCFQCGLVATMDVSTEKFYGRERRMVRVGTKYIRQ